MVSSSYGNILNIPIFGFGAKTTPYASQASPIFPLSRSLRNPFTPNESNVIDNSYTECLNALELSVPVNVSPIIEFVLSLGKNVRNKLDKKAKKYNHNIYKTIDSFYVLYIFFTGIVDDISNVIKILHKEEWNRLPIQIHFVSLAPANIPESD